ncbi:hypothetical protein ABS755_07970 [Castellaniella sp. FW104-16D08]|uniref:hypothetical protein n=1 Tax=unclassified Castellaniella TaxID=2617606 RepID=UPI003314CD0D
MAGVQTSFSLHMADVKAAALAAGRKDIRHYINTLTLDFQKDGLYLVGTDGHRIHVNRVQPVWADPITDPLTDRVVMVSIDLIDRLKYSKTADLCTWQIVELESKSAIPTYQVSIQHAGVTVQGVTSGESRELPWRRVIPASNTLAIGNPGCTLPADQMKDAVEALKLITGDRDPSFAVMYSDEKSASPTSPSCGAAVVGVTYATETTKEKSKTKPVNLDFMAYIMARRVRLDDGFAVPGWAA